MILSKTVVLGLILCGVPIALLGCGSEDDNAEAQAPTPVRTADVIYEETSIPVHTSGILSSSSETKLSFKVGGILGRILVDEGKTVEAGELLAELTPDEITASVTQAKSAYDKAERDLGRVKRLFEDSVATLEQLQDAETGFKVAGAQLEIAEFNRRHAAIKAPSAGRILKRFVEANELVGAGTPVFLFGSSAGNWIVRVGVTDRDVIRITLGDSASVRFDAYPGETFGAEVTEIAEAADPLSGAYEVELSLRGEKARMVSGFVASVDIHTSEVLAGHVIPIEALVEADGDRGYVYTPGTTGKTVKKVPVVIAGIIGNRVAIEAGLENVTEVVTDGAAYLSDGSHIEIADRKRDRVLQGD